MPHRPKPRGYEALDIWLSTQDSAKKALQAKDWTNKQQTHLNDFTDYATVNKFEFEDRFGNSGTRFRERKTGRFVKGY